MIVARAALGLAIAAALTSLLTVHALVEGQRELRASGTLLASGDFEQSIVRARRAASWYVPGAAHVPAAYERMIGIARVSEGRSDTTMALLSWRAVRSAALSSRWITQPHPHELAAANASIARLSATQARPQGAPEQPSAQLEQEMLEALSREERPFTGWVIVMLAGFGMFAGGLTQFGWRAVDASGAFDFKRVRPGLVVAAAGALAWMVALWRA
jgi:hypothetical protein